jgi:hypothetical protein
MATTAAAFSSFEEALCKYIAFGGTSGYTSGLPGMVTSPNVEASKAYIRLLKSVSPSDIRAVIPAYPTPFTTDASGVRGVGEPTTDEWSTSTYGVGATARRLVSASLGQLEVADLGSGNWCVRTKSGVTLTFTAPDAADDGCVITHAALCLPRFNTTTSLVELYALAIADFDTDLDAEPAGTNLTIPAQGLRFRVL